MITVYTDGSVTARSGAGVGVVITADGMADPIVFRSAAPCRMSPHHAEMYAILYAADALAGVIHLIPTSQRGRAIRLLTDSKVCHTTFSDVADTRDPVLKALAKAARKAWTTLRSSQVIHGYGIDVIKSADNPAHGPASEARALAGRVIKWQNPKTSDSGRSSSAASKRRGARQSPSAGS